MLLVLGFVKYSMRVQLKTLFAGSEVSQEFCGEKNTEVDGIVVSTECQGSGGLPTGL